jgi:integrase/recombinase XerD
VTEQEFVAERAVAAGRGPARWVVVDARDYALHDEASLFLAGVRARGCSPNTERAYAGRVALYLGYCRSRGLEWSAPGFAGLAGFQQWLVEEPLPARTARPARSGEGTGAGARFRSRGTANAVMVVAAEFLRFAAVHGWAPGETAGLLSRPRVLRFAPPGVPRRGGQRVIRQAMFRFKADEAGLVWLGPEQVSAVLGQTRHARDRFLVALLATTGLRIGEALGLRREDLHLLASSQAAGCVIEGPHVHVRRRTDNPNGALAKSRFARSVPVTADLVALWADYQYERDRARDAAGGPMVFVNLFRAPLGGAMTYANAREVFTRLGQAAGVQVRPHLLRHFAATQWLRAGVPRDVVQRLLGHRSPASMEAYRHVDMAEMRAAVEQVRLVREGV